MVRSWNKNVNTMTLVKNPSTPAPGRASRTNSPSTSRWASPKVGLPAFLAGRGGFRFPQRRADSLRRGADAGDAPRERYLRGLLHSRSISTAPPFDNLDVRRPLLVCHPDREEMTSTVLRDLAIPGRSLLSPSFPGYNEALPDPAVFDPEKAG